jgi:hypothetical protein
MSKSILAACPAVLYLLFDVCQAAAQHLVATAIRQQMGVS